MGSLLVDQSWVPNWKNELSAFEKDYVTSWLATQKKEWHPLLEKFPLFCIVRAKPGKILDMPAPYVLAIVRGYWEDGTLAITYEPTDDIEKCGVVNSDDVEVVSFWKGLDHRAIHRLLH